MRIAVAAVALAAVAACGTSGHEGGESAQSSDRVTPTQPEQRSPADGDDADTATRSESGDDSRQDVRHTFENGLEVIVAAPEDYASTHIRLTISVFNKTGAAFDAESFDLIVRSAGVEAPMVWDAAPGVYGTPNVQIAPGGTFQFLTAWSVQDPTDIAVELIPGPEYESATVTF